MADPMQPAALGMQRGGGYSSQQQLARRGGRPKPLAAHLGKTGVGLDVSATTRGFISITAICASRRIISDSSSGELKVTSPLHAVHHGACPWIGTPGLAPGSGMPKASHRQVPGGKSSQIIPGINKRFITSSSSLRLQPRQGKSLPFGTGHN